MEYVTRCTNCADIQPLPKGVSEFIAKSREEGEVVDMRVLCEKCKGPLDLIEKELSKEYN